MTSSCKGPFLPPKEPTFQDWDLGETEALATFLPPLPVCLKWVPWLSVLSPSPSTAVLCPATVRQFCWRKFPLSIPKSLGIERIGTGSSIKPTLLPPGGSPPPPVQGTHMTWDCHQHPNCLLQAEPAPQWGLEQELSGGFWYPICSHCP